MADDVEHLFIGYPYILFGEVYRSFAHLKIEFFFFFFFCTVEFWEYLLNSGYQPSVGYVTCKYFLPVCSLSFKSLNSVFYRAKGDNFCEI